jgi:cyclic beta-1,2-glucan synthetase
LAQIVELKDLEFDRAGSQPPQLQEYFDRVTLALTQAAHEADQRIRTFSRLERVNHRLNDSDYSFFYNHKKNVFSLGFDVHENMLARCHYDMLCSEARATGFLAIARGQVPIKHWFSLDKEILPLHSTSALRSWSGSMFEYLMPALLMPSMPGSILHSTYQHVV